jgi:hypothetical protein
LSLDDNWKIPTENDEKIIAVRQVIIGSLEVIEGFPKKIWEYCAFSMEEYFERRNEEKKTYFRFRNISKNIPRKHVFKEESWN